MSLSAAIQITDQDVYATNTTQGAELLGQAAVTPDGRMFRYGKNGSGGATALAPGKLAQVATPVANDTNRTGVTAVAGTTQLTFTLGSTTSANSYAQGYLVVNAGTGVGQSLLINGNTAATAGNSDSTTVTLRRGLNAATSVSDSKFSLVPHPYSACIIQAATLGAGSAGVPGVSVPDAAFAWFQTGGVASVLSDAGAAAIGAPITYSDDTAGAVGPYETDAVGVVLGYALILGVSAEYRQVFLTIN
jgi:hypothetical protein